MTEDSRSRPWLSEPIQGRRSRRDAKVTLARRTELLAKVPLFEGLSKKQLEDVARAARGSRWPEGTRVVEEGAHDSFLAIILEGQAEVLSGERLVARLKEGDFFGEIALLDAGPRTATVRTVTDVVAVELAREPFVRAVGSQPKALLRMLQTMARRNRDLAPAKTM